jgi:hypothetical protein
MAPLIIILFLVIIFIFVNLIVLMIELRRRRELLSLILGIGGYGGEAIGLTHGGPRGTSGVRGRTVVARRERAHLAASMAPPGAGRVGGIGRVAAAIAAAAVPSVRVGVGVRRRRGHVGVGSGVRHPVLSAGTVS